MNEDSPGNTVSLSHAKARAQEVQLLPIQENE